MIQWHRWKSQCLSSLFALSLIISLFFGVGIPIIDSSVIAQSTSKEELVQDIQAKAQRHVKIGKVASQDDLNNVFGKLGAQVGLGIAEIEEIYETAYLEAKETRSKSPWAAFRPQVGWAVAGILFVLLAFRDVLKDFIKANSKRLEEWIYNQFSGSQLFQNRALTRYRRALVEKHQQLKIPFRPNQPLEMADVFVPLKVAGSISASDQINTSAALAKHQRLMITGQPGSGKTMMLKQIVLRDLPINNLPINLEQ